MIAIDTNILVRHLTEDDAHQLKLVHKLFKAHSQDGEIFISLIVLLELNWVLEDCYHFSYEKFCDCLEDILQCPSFVVENPLVVKMAVSRCRKREDFSDALIGQIGHARGFKTYTFDQALQDDPSFKVLI